MDKSTFTANAIKRNGVASYIQEERHIFGRNLRRARKKTGLTQKDVERITGVTQAFLSNIEKGKTNSSLDTMVILSKGLSVPIWKLFLPFDAQDN
ncbi:helix-turn-helix domain-containing protein [Bartonella sp. DGB2]|uniref:helix-turn-helix domain-containing protein n=1 Tax=Bartonella sp. DGB2 TaxID=3388426 RepID=UPI00398FE101